MKTYDINQAARSLLHHGHAGKSCPGVRSVPLALPKLFLWSEPGRLQEYPEALSRAQAGRTYTRVEVERELFDIAPTMAFKGGAPRGQRTDGVVNTYGLEQSGQRYRLNGLNLLARTPKGLVPTEEGLELGSLFRADPDSVSWARALARQIARREPRTRLLLGLLLQGHRLAVAVSGTLPTGSLTLLKPDGKRVPIAQRGCESFNALLTEHAEIALGPAWRAALENLGAKGPVRWEGVQGGAPSTNDLPTALKKALAVFFHLNAFRGGEAGWYLEARDLQEALGLDSLAMLGLPVSEGTTLLTEDEAFTDALAATTDGDGFTIVSRLADRFGALLGVSHSERPAALDRFVRSAAYHNTLRLLEHHPGQPRMGRGLFGEPGSRRVRFAFHAVGHVAHNSSAQQQTPRVSQTQRQGEH